MKPPTPISPAPRYENNSGHFRPLIPPVFIFIFILLHYFFFFTEMRLSRTLERQQVGMPQGPVQLATWFGRVAR